MYVDDAPGEEEEGINGLILVVVVVVAAPSGTSLHKSRCRDPRCFGTSLTIHAPGSIMTNLMTSQDRSSLKTYYYQEVMLGVVHTKNTWWWGDNMSGGGSK